MTARSDCAQINQLYKYVVLMMQSRALENKTPAVVPPAAAGPRVPPAPSCFTLCGISLKDIVVFCSDIRHGILRLKFLLRKYLPGVQIKQELKLSICFLPATK